jgi:hypothetical protein
MTIRGGGGKGEAGDGGRKADGIAGQCGVKGGGKVAAAGDQARKARIGGKRGDNLGEREGSTGRIAGIFGEQRG